MVMKREARHAREYAGMVRPEFAGKVEYDNPEV